MPVTFSKVFRLIKERNPGYDARVRKYIVYPGFRNPVTFRKVTYFRCFSARMRLFLKGTRWYEKHCIASVLCTNL